MTRTHSERRTMVHAAAIAVFLLTSAASRGHGQVAQPRAPGSSARDLAPIIKAVPHRPVDLGSDVDIASRFVDVRFTPR